MPLNASRVPWTLDLWRSLATLANCAAAGLLGVSQPTSAADGKFVNISTRALVETGDEVMIGGFVIAGGPAEVLIQAIGPELAERGISNALGDPVLTVVDTTDSNNHIEVVVNDNWEDTQGEEIADLWGEHLPLTVSSLSSAAFLTLEPGNYTAKVEGKNGTAGVAIVEVYEIDSSDADGKFVNLSTRALVGTGEEVMIGGFIIEEGARHVLIQAVGPELAERGISNALGDPVLTVTNTTDPGNHRELLVNDNWEDSQGQVVTDLWGGSPPLAAGSLSSAVVLTLEPGNYTAKVEGKDGTAGVAIVEVYETVSSDAGSPDREALAALYHAMDGANWTRSNRWGTNAPLDQWYGVRVDDWGRVTSLNLWESQLSGPISAELGNLANLQSLFLHNNNLSGPIPAELGNLASLQSLWLYSNNLSGPIPTKLGGLSNLRLLWLHDNQLSGPIPTELSELSNLTSLSLSSNLLSGPVPTELSELSKLTSLWLGHNQLNGTIPAEFGELSNLRFLDLSDNQLSGTIPVELGDLGDVLLVLDLSNNQLSGPIPAELGQLTNLVRLSLSNNQLSGPIPAELGNPANLEAIYLGGNQFSGCIPNGLREVEENDFFHLGLPYCGTISSDRAALVALYNATDGPNWTNSANWLTDAPLGDWEGVTTDATTGRVVGLDLSENNLTGPIPPELADLGDVLLVLDLADNQLSGPIPAELGNFVNLEAIYLGGNQFYGCIPNGLWDVAEGDLSTLGLQDCGTIASDRAALVALYNATDGTNWANSANWLTDAPLGVWEGVTTDATTGRVVDLDLGENDLTGPIPAELGNLAYLEELWLPRNNLTGLIPAELGNLANLERLLLYGNQLNGPIPAELGNLANLETLSLSGNQLSGPIPAELGNLANLEELVLSENQLSGPIPAELGRLTSLKWLYLGNNQLSGPIPPELSDLYVLLVLDLADNQLSGPIPAELGNLANLQAIYLGGSQFSGCIPNGLREVARGDLSTLGLPYCGTIASDRTALVALYNATDGPNWANSDNWLTDGPLGDWEGVTTDATTGRVVGLDLAGNNLTGPIPHKLGDLGYVLLVLDLSDNQLSGPIPAELGNFVNLEAIYLGGNQISGCIPNRLREVAEGDLSTLGLQDCGTISSDRAALVALYNATDGTNWDSSRNWLTDAPLGRWWRVTADATGRVVGLDLAGYNLTGPIPAALGNLGYLETLSLSRNKLNGPIPIELGNLANLESLYLYDNQLSGPIPAELGDLANLKDLRLYDNQLSGLIPAELGNLANLKWLNLRDNLLTGPIPAELGNLANLEAIYLRGNQFSGCIPNELREVPRDDLLTLGLPYCGTISSDRAALVALYNATDGPNWTNSVNWLTDAPIGDWQGVTTDAITGGWLALPLPGTTSPGRYRPHWATSLISKPFTFVAINSRGASRIGCGM